MKVIAQDKIVLRCAGTNLRSAVAVRQQVSAALQTYSSVIIEVPHSDEIDLTFLQILISAQRTAGALGKELRLNSAGAKSVIASASAAGMPRRCT